MCIAMYEQLYCCFIYNKPVQKWYSAPKTFYVVAFECLQQCHLYQALQTAEQKIPYQHQMVACKQAHAVTLNTDRLIVW